MLRLIEERLRARRRADAVRLEVAADADDELVQIIVKQEQLRGHSIRDPSGYTEIYRIPGPVDLTVQAREVAAPRDLQSTLG